MEKHSKTIKLKPPEQKVPAWQAKWRQINKLSFHLFEACLYLNVIMAFHYFKLKIGWSFVRGLLFYHLLRIVCGEWTKELIKKTIVRLNRRWLKKNEKNTHN